LELNPVVYVFSGYPFGYGFTGEVFGCPNCEKTFSTKRSLKNHQDIHTDYGEGVLTCRYCQRNPHCSPSSINKYCEGSIFTSLQKVERYVS
jgi:hypothetical protein